MCSLIGGTEATGVCWCIAGGAGVGWFGGVWFFLLRRNSQIAPNTINERATKPPIEPPTIAPTLGPSFSSSVSTGAALVVLAGSTVMVVVKSSDSVGVSVSVSDSSGSSVVDDVVGTLKSSATVVVLSSRPLWPS